MPELKREPTPVGPIKDLFDQLHALHRSAGEPPVRHVAAAIGPRVISHGTVYSVFRGPKVPKLGNVVQVVEALNGDVPRFSKLWQAARDAERELANRANRVSKSTGRGAVGALKNRISTATDGLREAVKRAEADIARYDRELIEATAGVEHEHIKVVRESIKNIENSLDELQAAANIAAQRAERWAKLL